MKVFSIRSLVLLATIALIAGSAMSVDVVDEEYFSKKPGSRPERMVGEAVVRIVSGVSSESVVNRPGLVIVDSIPELRAYLVYFTGTKPVPGIVTALGLSPNIDFVEPNRTRSIPEMQQVSIGFPDQSEPVYTLGVEPSNYYGQVDGTYETGIEAAQSLASGSGVTIAVIDNGIEFSHPMVLANRLGQGIDFVDRDMHPAEDSGMMYGHGTFVSGLIWLTAPDCEIVPIRTFDGSGEGTDFVIAKAMLWAYHHDADVVNLSFGSPTAGGLMDAAASYLVDQGVTLVAAAGNAGTDDPMYPAAVPGVIAVSSIDFTEHRAEWANYGSHVSLMAPGVNLYSALAGEYDWGTWSGTSFSAPFVTGTVALMLERRSDLSPARVRHILIHSARVKTLWGIITPPSYEYGNGLLDAFNAVTALIPGDLNRNGGLDTGDLDMFVAMMTESSVPFDREAALEMADMNGDGQVNLTDLTLLSQLVTREKSTTR